jgi:hypothetical protein
MGLSDKPQDGYDTGTQAGDLVALTDALGHERFAVVALFLPGPLNDRLRHLGFNRTDNHFVAEEAPEEMLAALTAFLALYRD